jgi:serine/threonine protein kinase
MDDPVQVGRYEVQRVVGKGAMGVVYLAYDPQIGRRVALKTIRPAEGARPEEIEESRTRFLREARAAGKLLHPNIVTIFDVFEDRGILYIAMEYARAPSWIISAGVAISCLSIKSSNSPPRPSWRLNMHTGAGSFTGTSSPATSWSWQARPSK